MLRKGALEIVAAYVIVLPRVHLGGSPLVALSASLSARVALRVKVFIWGIVSVSAKRPV